MKGRKYLLTTVLLGLLLLGLLRLSTEGAGATLYVGPGQYQTIQAAIDAAVDGDTVIVADGTYKGAGNKNLDFKGKAITVRSENGAEKCIIDCERDGRGFYFHSHEGRSSIVSGFTITRGAVGSEGGGISCIYSSPTVTNCVLKQNSAVSGGGIYWNYESSPAINNCTISENWAGVEGAGLHCGYSPSPAVIANCVITGNSGTAIYYWSSSITIANCLITHNTGTGIFCNYNSIITVVNSVIADNTADYGAALYCRSGSNVTITNCTIGNNSSTAGESSIYCERGSATIRNSILWNTTHLEIYSTSDSTLAVTFCDVQGGFSGEGNFHGDPLFVDANNGNYRLSPSSPCMDAGTSVGAPATDIEGNPRPQNSGFDLGAYEVTGYTKNRPIIDSLVASTTQAYIPFDVTFTCTAHDVDGTIVSYTIDYGDGTAPETNSTGTFVHTYSSHGAGYATFTVIDDSGAATNSASIKVTRNGEIRVPSDYSTIQVAIDATIDGDRVLVADGTYKGPGNRDLDLKGKMITVRSENGPTKCIIDCERNGRGFYFQSKEDDNSVVSGFTITNGNGGILCSYASPRITDCIIISNSSGGDGGGIVCDWASPTITRCRINGNSTSSRGGAIGMIGRSSPVIRDCIITGNSAAWSGGGIHSGYSSPTIVNCVIAKNNAEGTGGGVEIGWQSSASVTNCSFSENSAGQGGGGIHCQESSTGTVTNSILWSDMPSEIFVSEDSTLVVEYCDVRDGYPGEGNFEGDPLFVNPSQGDYRLLVRSPCMDAGIADGVPDTDIEGNLRPQNYRVDLGAYEVSGYDKNRPIVDSFVANTTVVYAPSETTFTCTAHDPDGWIVSYTMDYGDGTAPETNSNGIFTHTYNARGWDYATSTITDDSGASVNSVSIKILRNGDIRVPSEYSTIQAAINAARDGDQVIVADGIYTGSGNKNIDLNGKAITVRSENGPTNCIIDCQRDGSGFVIQTGEGPSSVVSGFTIQRGYTGFSDGGGIKILLSSPLITGNVIIANERDGISMSGACSPTIHGNYIANNSVGIRINGSSPSIDSNLITRNHGVGVTASNIEAISIKNNTISYNESHGIELHLTYYNSNTLVTNNTITENTLHGLNVNLHSASSFFNNIISNNKTCGFYLDPTFDFGQPYVDYNDVFGNNGGDYCGVAVAGTNDLQRDPRLIDPSNDNYHLWPISPCVDTGRSEGAPSVDFENDVRPLDGNGDGTAYVDIGADELPLSPGHNVAPTAAMPLISYVKQGGTVVPEVKVLNPGSSTEKNLTVTCELWQSGLKVYTDTRAIAEIASMGTVDIAFAPWTAKPAGIYQVKVYTQLALDQNPANDIQTRTLNVISLNAAFTSDKREGTSPLTVHFVDLSTGPIDKWLWDFGDGTVSNANAERNPTHIYAKPGNFTVSLSVSGFGFNDTEAIGNYIYAKCTLTFDVFGLQVGNKWTYQGSQHGTNFYTSTSEVVSVDTTTFSPTTTYVIESRENNALLSRDWYQTTSSELRYWGFYDPQDGYFRLSAPLINLWYPMGVGDQRKSSTRFYDYSDYQISQTVRVVANEPVTLGFATLSAYKLQVTQRIWGPGLNETATFFVWWVPYLADIKLDDGEYLEMLTSFAIGGGVITETTDHDGDGLLDYEEIAIDKTDWQDQDTDHDSMPDGWEVNNGLDPLSNDALADADGDGFSNLREYRLGKDPRNPRSHPPKGLPWIPLLLGD